jgi:DnaJ-domain-containing protein 1
MRVQRITVDFAERRCDIELVDGSVTSFPAPAGFYRDGDPVLRRVCSDLTTRELHLTLPMGDEVTVEVGDAAGGDLPQAGRPVVYLDQFVWVRLAQLLWAPNKVVGPEREAGLKLIEMARNREVILPLSAAHLTEAKSEGPRRRHLVTTMIELSRGWQMRSPLVVRRRELRATMAGANPALENVFTLEPEALFAEPPGPTPSGDDFPPALRELHQRTVAAQAVYSTMIEDNPKNAEGMRLAELWATSHEELAQHIRENPKPKEHMRMIARARLMADISADLDNAAADTGMEVERFSHWLEHDLESDLARMPHLGRHYEVIFDRLRNADDHWERNDLNDVIFLSCAAGYADVVVGERKTSEYLRRAQRRVAGGAFVCRNIAAAVSHLEAIRSPA